MRTLFLHTERDWSGCARAFEAAALGLAARGHQVTMVCAANSTVEQRLTAHAGDSIEIVPLPEGSTAGDAWRLRTVLQERFVEVVFVHTEREQLAVASAMRLAERGAVVRRIAMGLDCSMGRSARFASRIAATALLFGSEDDRDCATLEGYKLGAFVAALGVDAADYDDVEPVSRRSVGAPAQSRLIVCAYEPRAKHRLATVFRTMALIAPRHPELHLALLGRGSDAEDIRMHAAALGINHIVSHLGEREDHLQILASADVGWVAAEHDDAAYAFLDLMALRVPVLSERGRIPERYVADGITGALISPGDPSETAAKVAAFVAHDEQRVSMGKAGRTRLMREFPAIAFVEGMEEALHAAGDRTAWAAK